jgi:hypothetical protein
MLGTTLAFPGILISAVGGRALTRRMSGSRSIAPAAFPAMLGRTPTVPILLDQRCDAGVDRLELPVMLGPAAQINQMPGLAKRCGQPI